MAHMVGNVKHAVKRGAAADDDDDDRGGGNVAKRARGGDVPPVVATVLAAAVALAGSAFARCDTYVMHRVMSFLPEVEAGVRTRYAVRTVCRAWHDCRYARWVHPPSAYTYALMLGDIAHANVLRACVSDRIRFTCPMGLVAACRSGSADHVAHMLELLRVCCSDGVGTDTCGIMKMYSINALCAIDRLWGKGGSRAHQATKDAMLAVFDAYWGGRLQRPNADTTMAMVEGTARRYASGVDNPRSMQALLDLIWLRLACVTECTGAVVQHLSNAMCVASERGAMPLLRVLLRNALRIGPGAAQIRAALRGGHRDVLRALLAARQYRTVLPADVWQMACATDRSDLLTVLLDIGDHFVHAFRNMHVAQMMRLATESGHVTVVQALVEHRHTRDAAARVLATNVDLRVACVRGHANVVHALLQCGGVNPTKGGADYFLRVAINNGHRDVVEVLLGDARVRVSPVALRAAHRGGHLDTCKTLLEHYYRDDRDATVKTTIAKEVAEMLAPARRRRPSVRRRDG